MGHIHDATPLVRCQHTGHSPFTNCTITQTQYLAVHPLQTLLPTGAYWGHQNKGPFWQFKKKYSSL